MCTLHARFLHVWCPVCMLSRCSLTKFLHRSSVGSLLGVHCWLGLHTVYRRGPFSLSPSLLFFGRSEIEWNGEGGKREKENVASQVTPFGKKKSICSCSRVQWNWVSWEPQVTRPDGYTLAHVCSSLYPSSPVYLRTQPPTAACKIEAQLEYVHVAHTFFARLAPICTLSRCLLTKFLHRSSVGSLIRVRCWLGSSSVETQWEKVFLSLPAFSPPLPFPHPSAIHGPMRRKEPRLTGASCCTTTPSAPQPQPPTLSSLKMQFLTPLFSSSFPSLLSGNSLGC